MESTIDSQSPFAFDIREFGHRPGAMRSEHVHAPAPEGLGTVVIGVPAGSDIDCDVRLEAVMEGVLATGTVTGRVHGECVRCLDPVESDVEVPFQELFLHENQREDVGDDEDFYEVKDDILDIEPMLRDVVVASLPFRPLCREDCPGLCDQCGIRLADNPDHAHESIDPRWSVLKTFSEASNASDER